MTCAFGGFEAINVSQSLGRMPCLNTTDSRLMCLTFFSQLILQFLLSGSILLPSNLFHKVNMSEVWFYYLFKLVGHPTPRTEACRTIFDWGRPPTISHRLLGTYHKLESLCPCQISAGSPLPCAAQALRAWFWWDGQWMMWTPATTPMRSIAGCVCNSLATWYII